MELNYSTPEVIIKHAEAQSNSQVALDNNPSELRLRRYHYSDLTDDEFTQLKRDHHAGLAVAETISLTTSEDELFMSVAALRQWLGQRNDKIHAYTTTTPYDYRIPAHMLRQVLLKKVVDLDAINNLDRMDAVAESLFPLAHPQDNAKMSKYAAKGFSPDAESYLTRLGQYEYGLDESQIFTEVALYASLTDRGIFDEKMWGKVGIQRFSEKTPFAITAETHRRFVIEGKDIYAPVTRRAHLNTLTKYCYEVIEQTALDQARNTNITGIQNALRMSKKDNVSMMLNPIVRLANIITVSANQHGGIPDVDGTLQICQALPERNQAIIGEAMRRILYATRVTQATPDLTRQIYQDSLFTDIIHELALVGADVQSIAK